MDELIAFVTARLDEDERIAWTVTPDDWGDGDESSRYEWEDLPDAAFVHAKRHDPARVLREVAADRALLAELEHAATADFGITGEPYDAGWYGSLELAVKIRAAVWSDHPDYRQEWAPEPVR